MIDIKQALNKAITRLTPTSSSAQVDAEVLLAFTLTKSRTFLYTHPEQALEHTQCDAYDQLINKRYEGMPIAYLTGNREFWSLQLQLDKDTLIPRPETELLVELTLDLLKNKTPASILDLGTGSGAIALALASERPDWQVLACDISNEALTIADHNAALLGINNVLFLASDWFTSLPKQHFHAIISNPPYLAEDDPHLKQGDVRFEPKRALVSGVDGLDSLRHIIQYSFDRLLPDGLLLVEHGFLQKEAVTTLFRENGYQNIQCWQDIQGHDRVSGGWRA